MPRAFTLLIFLLLFANPAAFDAGAALPPREDVVAAAEQVCAYELDTHAPREMPSQQWCESVFYLGALAAFDLTGDERFAAAPREWAERRQWRLGPRPRHADDLSAAQVYLELWRADGDTSALASVRAAFDEVASDPRPGIEEWSWCDALFMAPPAMASLSEATGDGRYVGAMDEMWWDVVSHLYDTEAHLFYRDMRSRSAAETVPGIPRFWGRGNGWVMVGTVRVLDALPLDHPSRGGYLELLCEMAGAVADLQGEDGLWRPDLLRSRELPNPDTSCSALFCCAIAWGIAEGVLPEQRFLPVVESAWDGLMGALDEQGRLGWVQQIAAEPGAVRLEDSSDFGAGVFLLSAREVARLAGPRPERTNPR